jgi:hypothetical protein
MQTSEKAFDNKRKSVFSAEDTAAEPPRSLITSHMKRWSAHFIEKTCRGMIKFMHLN